MGFLAKKSTEKKEALTIECYPSAMEDLKILLNNLTALEIKILRQVSEKPMLKSMAINQAKKFI